MVTCDLPDTYICSPSTCVPWGLSIYISSPTVTDCMYTVADKKFPFPLRATEMKGTKTVLKWKWSEMFCSQLFHFRLIILAFAGKAMYKKRHCQGSFARSVTQALERKIAMGQSALLSLLTHEPISDSFKFKPNCKH